MIRELGAIALFASGAARILFRRGVKGRDFVMQIYDVGVRSLPVTIVTGLFVGAIMVIQINLQLRDFGAQGFLGGLTTSVTLRNVGPVLIAFILSGKVGAYTSAELGTMRVTDQIDAIRCLGMDPIEYLILPRLVAVVISSTLLLLVGLVMTVAGGLVFSELGLGVNHLNYLANIPRFVTGHSLLLGAMKSVVFGTLIGVFACYRGYTAKGGARGVGETVRDTSVQILVAIIVMDYLVSEVASFILGGAV